MINCAPSPILVEAAAFILGNAESILCRKPPTFALFQLCFLSMEDAAVYFRSRPIPPSASAQIDLMPACMIGFAKNSSMRSSWRATCCIAAKWATTQNGPACWRRCAVTIGWCMPRSYSADRSTFWNFPGRYTHMTAISNERPVAVRDGELLFCVRNRDRPGKKPARQTPSGRHLHQPLPVARVATRFQAHLPLGPADQRHLVTIVASTKSSVII